MDSDRSPRLLLLLVAVIAFATGLVGSEATFGRLRPPPDGPLLYSVEVRDQEGALVAHPLLVGEDRARVHLDLSRPDGAGLMSLDLDAEPLGEQAICLGYRLSLDDGTRQEGRVSLPLGEPRQVRSEGAGDRLRVKVRVARAGSKAYQEMLRARRLGHPLS